MKIKATITPANTGKPREVFLPADFALDEATAARLGLRDGDTIKVEVVLEEEPFDPRRIKHSYGEPFDPKKFDPSLLTRITRR